MVLRNMFSMTGLNVVKALSAFAVSTLMAGLVPPEKYGLIAFAIPLMAFLTLLTDLGLTSAIVRHPNLSSEEAGAAFGILGLFGLIAMLILAVAARPLETLLSLSGLTPVLVGFSLVTAFSIWATAPRALLERKLRYPVIAVIEAVSLAAALAVFTLGVKLSLGVMALVGFHIALQGCRALAFGFTARTFFSINLRYSLISALAKVGGWVFLSNLLAYSARNVDRLMIGSFLGAASLGLYSLGYQFMTIPLVLITWPISGVLLSTLARLGGDGKRKADMICAVITGTVAISFPMMTFLMFGARFPIKHFLSEHWQGVTGIIAILAPVGIVQSVSAYNGAILIERGAVKLNFNLALLSSLSLCTVFVTTVWLKITALIITYSVVSIAVSLVMIYYMCRVAEIGAKRFFSCLITGAISAVFGVASFLSVAGDSPTSWEQWSLGFSAYALAALLAYFLDRKRLIACVEVFVNAGKSIKIENHLPAKTAQTVTQE